MTFTSRNNSKVEAGVFIDIPSPCFMNEEKARKVKEFFQDSLEVIKRESLGFYYIVKNYENTSQVMREASLTVKIPLTILCADKPPFDGDEAVRWKHCMEIFAAQLTNRKYLLVKNAGHYIFIDNQKLVIDEIIARYNK